MITAIRLEFLKLRTTRMWPGMLALGGGLTILAAVTESARSGAAVRRRLRLKSTSIM